MNEIANSLINKILNIIQNNDANLSCLTSIDMMGELTYHLNLQNDAGPKLALTRDINNFTDQAFTLDNRKQIQIGFVNTDTRIGENVEYGMFTNVGNVRFKYDILLIVHEKSIAINVGNLASAFGGVEDVQLEHIEVNPVKVILSHGLIPPKSLNNYSPKMRAFAFTYWTNYYPQN